MSASNPAPPPQAAAPQKRNPVEKLIVRGLIALLLVLVGVEFAFSRSHSSAMLALQKKISEVEKDPNAPAVHEADVKAAVGDKKPISSEELKGRVANGAKRLDIYEWFTLNPFNQRRLYVYYGHVGPNDPEGAEVLEVQPDEQVAPSAQPSAEDLKAMKDSTLGPPPSMGGMMGGPGGGGHGPGGLGGGRPGGRRGAPPAQDSGTDDAKPDSDKPADDKDADDKPKDEDKDQ
jgi:hypothetical protein